MSEYLINQSGRCFSKEVKPNPLEGELTMVGIDIELGSSGRAYRYASAYDGRNLWVSKYGGYDKLTCVDTVTDHIDYIPISDNSYPGLTESELVQSSCVYDGQYIWFRPYKDVNPLVRLDPQTRAMDLFENVEDPNAQQVFNCGVFDGNSIWFSSGRGKLLRVDCQTGIMSQVPVTDSINPNIKNLTFDGESVWFTASRSASAQYDLYQLNPDTLSVEYRATVLGTAANNCDCILYAGSGIWMIPSRGVNEVIKYDIPSQALISYSMDEGINGNKDMGQYRDYKSAVFDGRYIWMAPSQGDRLLRLDTDTGTMKGFVLAGRNMGTWLNDSLVNKCYDSCFDGKNLWLIPNNTDKLVKISSNKSPMFFVEQFYQDEQGNQIIQSEISWFSEGDTYTSTAPTVEGYITIGYHIDLGELQSGTATIPNIHEDHTVTFLYRKTDDCPDPNPTPGTGCCCCCQPKLHIDIPITQCNAELIRKVCETLSRGAQGCCHTKEE